MTSWYVEWGGVKSLQPCLLAEVDRHAKSYCSFLGVHFDQVWGREWWYCRRRTPSVRWWKSQQLILGRCGQTPYKSRPSSTHNTSTVVLPDQQPSCLSSAVSYDHQPMSLSHKDFYPCGVRLWVEARCAGSLCGHTLSRIPATSHSFAMPQQFVPRHLFGGMELGPYRNVIPLVLLCKDILLCERHWILNKSYSLNFTKHTFAPEPWNSHLLFSRACWRRASQRMELWLSVERVTRALWTSLCVIQMLYLIWPVIANITVQDSPWDRLSYPWTTVCSTSIVVHIRLLLLAIPTSG